MSRLVERSRTFAVTSANHKHGNQFSVILDGEMVEVEGDRGIGIVVVDYNTRNVCSKHMFDTSQQTTESDKLAKTIERIKDGDYVIMGVKGDGARKLTNELKTAIANLGSDEIYNLNYEDSWAMIVRKDYPKSIRETRQLEAVTIKRTDDF